MVREQQKLYCPCSKDAAWAKLTYLARIILEGIRDTESLHKEEFVDYFVAFTMIELNKGKTVKLCYDFMDGEGCYNPLRKAMDFSGLVRANMDIRYKRFTVYPSCSIKAELDGKRKAILWL